MVFFFGKSLFFVFFFLAKVDGLQVPADVPFLEQCFWVRIHGLPSTFMTREMGEVIVAAMGRYVTIDCENDLCFGEFMRIRVVIDVFKPLQRGVQLRLPSSERGGLIKVLVRYEQLTTYCFLCGIHDHKCTQCH